MKNMIMRCPMRQKLFSKVFMLCFLGCVPLLTNGQKAISLQAALDSSRINNLSLKNEKLKVEYAKLTIRTSTNIPQTLLFTENGQVNSRYTDHRFGLAQTINFPTVYARQRNVFNQGYQISMTGLSLKELDLKKQVITTYYHLAYLQEKENILLKNDTIYAIFQDKAKLRFKAGESNVLERSTAEIQRNQIAMQLRELQQDKAIYLLQLQWLLNSREQYIPDLEGFKMQIPDYDSTLIEKHPQIRMLMQEQQSAIAQTRLEKSRLLPDLNITYNNMSMYGVGADNVFYQRSTRFQSVQLGLGIPLFTSAQRGAVKVSQSQEKIAESDYEVAVNTMNNHWEQTIALYQKYQETLRYYETIGLKNADLIITTVNQQFASGEINYLNWVTLTNQALGVKSEYLDAINNHNETIIEIMYMMGQ
jgi:cobalt-zinc-cadmium resistance protein CzcA